MLNRCFMMERHSGTYRVAHTKRSFETKSVETKRLRLQTVCTTTPLAHTPISVGDHRSYPSTPTG